jgi:hypothetical protein
VEFSAPTRDTCSCGPVLSTLHTKVYVVPRLSCFSSGSLGVKHDRSTSGLYSGDDHSRLGHLCLQDGNIYAALR